MEANGERGGGTAGEVDVTGGVAGAKAAVEARGHGLASGGQAGGRRVAVQLRGRQLQRAGDGGAHGLRCRDGGVAQAEVKDVFRADLGLAGAAVGGNLADGGLLRAVGVALLVDGHGCSVLMA